MCRPVIGAWAWLPCSTWDRHGPGMQNPCSLPRQGGCLSHWTTRVLSQTISMTDPQRFFLFPLLPVHPHVISGLGVLNHRSDHSIILSALCSMQTFPAVSSPSLSPALSLLLPLYGLQTRSETLHLCTPEVRRCDLCPRCSFMLAEFLSMNGPPPGRWDHSLV